MTECEADHSRFGLWRADGVQRNAFAGLQPGDMFALSVPIALSLIVASIAYSVAEVRDEWPRHSVSDFRAGSLVL